MSAAVGLASYSALDCGALGALQVGAADEVAAATRELVAEDKLTQRSREAEDALRRGAAGAVASK